MVKFLPQVGLLCASFLLLLPFAAMSQDKVPACQAATAAVDYGNWLKVSDKTKTLIDSYRMDWKNLCDPKSKTKASLSQLFAKAKEIESDFKTIFEAFDDALLNDSNFDPHRIDEFDNLVTRQIPRFVPAFHGAYGEHEFFSPSAEAFRENAALGNSEDRTFFESHIPLEGDFPPFIRRTWEYGGCDQFGDFDWTDALKTIARVKKQVKSPAYLKDTSLFEQSIFKEIGMTGDSICTCKAKEAVLKDLLDIDDYLKKEPDYSKQASAVQQTIDGVKSGRIKVNSELEKHCSGG